MALAESLNLRNSGDASDYYSEVALRPASKIITGPVPPDFHFLENASPPQSYRVRFRHPAYPNSSNVLLSLHAWDQADGGIHYGLAHTACAIIANNRFDGYLSREIDGSSRIEAEWSSCLPAESHGYYFHVPPPPGKLCLHLFQDRQADLLHVDHDPSQSHLPYRWAFVPSFQDWKYPRILPEIWQRCSEAQVDSLNSTAQSDQGGAVLQRDIICKVSAHSTSTEVAHLIPTHESTWFNANGMWQFNNNTTLDATNLLRDPNNALLLRADIHKAFDDRKFCLFPKDEEGFVVHVLQSAADLRLLYHNTRFTIPQCEVNYVLARFAWAIFPSVSGFLWSTQKSRLVVQWVAAAEDWIETEVAASSLAQRSVASRSNSPTKRSRIASSIDEHVEEDFLEGLRGRKRKRGTDIDAVETRRPSSTSERSISMREWMSPSMTDVAISDVEPDASSAGQSPHTSNLNDYRQEILARQRPSNYCIPAYSKHRDAREELELMGIDIIDNDFINENDEFT
jgi:hypothetical protein